MLRLNTVPSSYLRVTPRAGLILLIATDMASDSFILGLVLYILICSRDIPASLCWIPLADDKTDFSLLLTTLGCMPGILDCKSSLSVFEF